MAELLKVETLYCMNESNPFSRFLSETPIGAQAMKTYE
jgi:hypothetical protein